MLVDDVRLTSAADHCLARIHVLYKLYLISMRRMAETSDSAGGLAKVADGWPARGALQMSCARISWQDAEIMTRAKTFSLAAPMAYLQMTFGLLESPASRGWQLHFRLAQGRSLQTRQHSAARAQNSRPAVWRG